MAPKQAGTTTKPKAAPEHGTYKDMIRVAIFQLKERNGSSRQAIKKYIQANNKLGNTDETALSRHVNNAISAGVKAGDFVQPKGASGTVKLAKPTAKTDKAASTKSKTAKATTTKKATTAKSSTTKKAAATGTESKTVKKAAAPKKATAAKTGAVKANDAKPRKTVKKTAAPSATGDKVKTGRVSKTSAAKPAKKTAPKKATTAAPKKAAAAAS